MDDAVEFVEDVRLGVREVLLVVFDVVEQVLDFVLDLVFLAVVRGLAPDASVSGAERERPCPTAGSGAPVAISGGR